MRRAISLIALASVLLVIATTVWAADRLVSLYVGGKEVKCNPAARMRNDVTYAPLRAAAEAVGAHVNWVAQSQTATICTDTRCVPIKASQGIMVSGSILIPVRLMGEALGRQVTWDPANQAVRIGGSRKTL